MRAIVSCSRSVTSVRTGRVRGALRGATPSASRSSPSAGGAIGAMPGAIRAPGALAGAGALAAAAGGRFASGSSTTRAGRSSGATMRGPVGAVSLAPGAAGATSAGDAALDAASSTSAGAPTSALLAAAGSSSSPDSSPAGASPTSSLRLRRRITPVPTRFWTVSVVGADDSRRRIVATCSSSRLAIGLRISIPISAAFLMSSSRSSPSSLARLYALMPLPAIPVQPFPARALLTRR